VDNLAKVAVPVSRNTDWTQPGLGASAAFGPWKSISVVFSVQWSETYYTNLQEGTQADQSLAATDTMVVDTSKIPVVLVLRDSSSKAQYLVGSTTQTAPLVPWLWTVHRRDQCWTTQVVAVWKPVRWASLRAAWVWSRNISNLDNYVDGASYIRNVVSLSGALSW
jgi:outer membrane receptor protein involved in Fe transport